MVRFHASHYADADDGDPQQVLGIFQTPVADISDVHGFQIEKPTRLDHGLLSIFLLTFRISEFGVLCNR